MVWTKHSCTSTQVSPYAFSVVRVFLSPAVSRSCKTYRFSLSVVLLLLIFLFFPDRKLATFDTWSSLAVHIAMDNTVVMEEISKFHCGVLLCCSSKLM